MTERQALAPAAPSAMARGAADDLWRRRVSGWLANSGLGRISAMPGALRNAAAIGALTVLLAASMLIDSIAFPLPGEAFAAFNRLALAITAGLFLLAVGSLALILLGQSLVGRFGLVLYGCGLVAAMSVVVGPAPGVDIIGTMSLIAAPALIFSGREWRSLAVAMGLALATATLIQFRNLSGAPPLFALDLEDLRAVRISVVLVAAIVGFVILHLYRATETARGLAAAEQVRSEALLLNILPRAVAMRLKDGEEVIADAVDDAAILFADISGFTSYAANRPPEEVVGVLNRLFSTFDRLAVAHRVEKIKTIGDGYMAVAGLPGDDPGGPADAARLALAMQAAVVEFRRELPLLDLRIGLHLGPVVAGVIGATKFAYDIWGDAVNTASRLESSGEPGMITISAGMRAALGPGFATTALGIRTLKGKGGVPVWRLDGEAKPELSASEIPGKAANA